MPRRRYDYEDGSWRVADDGRPITRTKTFWLIVTAGLAVFVLVLWAALS